MTVAWPLPSAVRPPLRSALLCCVGLPALMATQALGDPLAAAPAVNWSGFYAGLNAGGAWGRSNATTDLPCTNAPNSYLCKSDSPSTLLNGVLVGGSGTGAGNASGATFGAQAGVNWQSGPYVTGVEVDLGSMRLRASRQAAGTVPFTRDFTGPVNYTIGSTVGTDWLFTARGRFGWAFDRFLAYGTAGLAVTSLSIVGSYVDTEFGVGRGTWQTRSVKVGWTAGAGGEFAIDRHWSVKFEYLYLNFPSVRASGQITNPVDGGYAQGVSTSADLTAHIARAGVNYRF